MLIIIVLICDDDISIHHILSERVEDYFEKKGIECRFRFFSDGRELLEAYHAEAEVREADLIFLDVHMPRLNGIATAEALRERNCKADLIFLTACKKYVFSAFRLNTFRYLLKPLSEDDLNEALGSFCRKLPHDEERLQLRFADSFFSIPYNEITYIEVMRGKIWIYTDTESFRWSGALDTLEDKLPSPPFFRVHRSYLINLHRVISYNSEYVILSGKKIAISRYRYHAFREAYHSCMKAESET